MRFGSILGRDFYDRPCLEVARDLVGTILCRKTPDGGQLAGRIVETEAYLGIGSDPASHAHGGPTNRNQSMFGPPGRLYVYRSYGIHLCLNLVCEPRGEGAAVLVRALEPLAGIEAMRGNRGIAAAQKDRLIAAGPGRLTEALGVGIEMDGESVIRGPLVVRSARGASAPSVVTAPRIGISKAVDRPFRFCAEASHWLSRPVKARKRATW